MIGIEPTTEGVILAAVAATGLAIQALCIRVGLRRGVSDNQGRAIDVLVIVLLSNLAVFVPLSVLRESPAFGLTRTGVVVLVFAGVVGFLLGRILHFESINIVGASRTEPIKSSQPIHATIIAIVFLGESVTEIHALGIVLITIGIAAISWETTTTNALELSRKELLVGLFLPLLAALFYGIEPVLTTIGLTTGVPVVVAGAIEAGVALLGVLAYRYYSGSSVSLSYFTAIATRWYLTAGLANTLFVLAYFRSLTLAPVSIVIPIVQLSPILVIFFSMVFIQRLEKVTWKLIASAVVVIVGAILITGQA